jgi:hypothetical protein
MNKLIVLAALLMALPSFALANDDPPPRKPGLWEMTVEGGSKPMTVQSCVDAASEKKDLEKGKALLASTCSKVESHLSGDTYVPDTVCDLMGAKQTSHSVTTISDGLQVTVIDSKYDPPKPMLEGHQTKRTMKWIGACGTDMKPGQMKVDGSVMPAPSN